MLENTNKRLQASWKGRNPADSNTSWPDVDRGRGDHKNLKCIILSEDGFYWIRTEFGKLESLYTRNQFSICKDTFLDPDSVPDKQISLRSAAKNSSSGTGQGHFFCKCTTNIYGLGQCCRSWTSGRRVRPSVHTVAGWRIEITIFPTPELLFLSSKFKLPCAFGANLNSVLDSYNSEGCPRQNLC